MGGMTAAFSHITVPVDGSPTAERGVTFALEIARGGGVLTFCSVVDPSLVCLPGVAGTSIDPGPMLAALDDNAAEFCRRAQARASAASVACDTRVLHGESVAAVAALARANSSQAIVVGTHARTGFKRGILGSFAEGLIRRSDVPVVAVHEDDLVRAGPIAVALDDSPAAYAALEVAGAIAAERGVPLLAICACESLHCDRQRVDALLAEAVKRAAARGVPAQGVVGYGVAADVLLAVADEHACSMIVTGTHGRAFFERLLLGSVAASLVERARVPVVTVRRSLTKVRLPAFSAAEHRSSAAPSFADR